MPPGPSESRWRLLIEFDKGPIVWFFHRLHHIFCSPVLCPLLVVNCECILEVSRDLISDIYIQFIIVRIWLIEERDVVQWHNSSMLELHITWPLGTHTHVYEYPHVYESTHVYESPHVYEYPHAYEYPHVYESPVVALLTLHMCKKTGEETKILNLIQSAYESERHSFAKSFASSFTNNHGRSFDSRETRINSCRYFECTSTS